MPREIVADHHRVMPAGQPIEGQILQHQHRIAGGHFGQQIAQLRGASG